MHPERRLPCCTVRVMPLRGASPSHRVQNVPMTDTRMADLDPPDLSDWGLHCFCIGARQTPHRAATADNNGRILYLARSGTTRDELAAAGVPCLDSQIALLQMLGVLTVKGGVLRTAFPTLGSTAMLPLRELSRRKAAFTAECLGPATRRIGDVLASTGARSHQYAVVFGHALDGLMWDRLRLAGRLPSTELSVDRPHWNGAFWAISPKRTGAAGTNERSRGSETLVMVWTDDTVAGLRTLARAWEQGEWTDVLPVVGADRGDPLQDACEEVARTAASALTAFVDELFADGFGCLTQEQLLLIAGHEFIWDAAAQLCRLGHLEEPRVLRNGAVDCGGLKSLTYVRSQQYDGLPRPGVSAG